MTGAKDCIKKLVVLSRAKNRRAGCMQPVALRATRARVKRSRRINPSHFGN